jgi:hypothetical protein
MVRSSRPETRLRRKSRAIKMAARVMAQKLAPISSPIVGLLASRLKAADDEVFLFMD